MYLFKVYYNCLEVFSYWVGQKVYLGFLVTSYGKSKRISRPTQYFALAAWRECLRSP